MPGTWIVHLEHDPRTLRLTLHDKAGGKRVFGDVPVSTAIAFEVAPDWTAFFEARIRGKYREIGKIGQSNAS